MSPQTLIESLNARRLAIQSAWSAAIASGITPESAEWQAYKGAYDSAAKRYFRACFAFGA